MRKTLKAGFSLFRIRVSEGFQYRIAALSNATIGAFWALIEIIVITVFFTYGTNANTNINGMNLRQSITYIWIAQSILGLSGMGIDGDIRTKIISGDIGVELCRPLDLYWHWFARSAAAGVSSVLMRGGLVFVCGIILSLIGFKDIGASFPASPLNFLLFLISIFGALLFGTAFKMFLTSIRMGVAWGDGPLNIIDMSCGILSGSYLPLQLWPDFMQNFLKFQPFAASLDTPIRLYIGSAGIKNGLVSIVFQAVWIVIFIIAGRIIMRNKIKNLIVQGG